MSDPRERIETENLQCASREKAGLIEGFYRLSGFAPWPEVVAFATAILAADAKWRESNAPTQFDTADVVRHLVSGEEWLLAYAEGKYVYLCGWPDSRAYASDCELVEKASPEKREKLLRQMVNTEGHRGDYARAKLAETAAADAAKEG